MTERLRKLIEEQQRIWARMQEIQSAAETENRDWTAEERTNWDEANRRLDEVSGDIERLQIAARRESEQAPQVGDQPEQQHEPQDHERDYRTAFETYMRHGMDRVAPEQRELLMAHFQEHRDLGAGTNAAGGYTVPEGFRNTITDTMQAYGGLLNVVNVITTSTGNDLPWPTNDDTANKGAILGEGTQIAEQDLTFGQNRLGAFTYTSKLVRVSWQLLQDSAFDLGDYLPRKLGERIGRAVADHLATGTGAGQPEGVLTNITVGHTGADVGAGNPPVLTYDDLVELEHSVDPAYRPNARFVMGDATLKLARKVKDADGRPIWQPVPAPGFPPTLNGVQYTIDNSFPAPAADTVTIVYGDLQAGYIVRRVQDVQMVRLAERYADFLQTGFFGFSRLDATPDDPGAIRGFQHGSQA